ncbi:MFS transporter, putative [Penicillium digitatum PHI26]|uniref:MFS transporter, putative n=2 Tax=Penicillium digitatum TaxID=36651 RepID=K9G8X5_PEND2|nr:MFS transporter, putative [Penicillium digitatum Pd1]EKV17447.1 MFS transporter, putative [Penicillium digitatum PHI26]EKV21896.1 MFS transporter, putative [Penicillium digitatum Pd1]
MAPVIDSSSVPGTVTLVDMDHILETRHLNHGDHDIVLIPTPSKNPDDPLNWSPQRKLLSTVCVSVPYASTKGQWLARNIILGFFTAPVEAIPQISVTDVYFTHERGAYMGLYAFFLAGSNYFAPVICGFIAQYQGWRWVFYYPSIFAGCAIIFLFFFCEETNFIRAYPDEPSASTPTEPPKLGSEDEKEKSAALDMEAATGVSIRSGHTKKSFAKKLALWGPRQEQNTLFRRLWQCLYFLSWPVIFYSGFSYGSYLVYFNILNGTASIILGGEPYHFGSSMIGLSYLGPITGVILGSLFTGRFSDWLTIKLARQNNGVMEAEHRLWPFLACIVLVPGSLILWGVGAAHEIHWFGLVVAMCMLAFTSTCGITLSVNYFIDSYQELSGIAMASVILVRNTMSFAIGYGITPWIENMGYQNCFISAAFIGMACASVFLFMIKFGKTFRERSREKYWKLVQENWENGMGK